MLKSLLGHLWLTFLPTLGGVPAKSPIIAYMTILPQPPGKRHIHQFSSEGGTCVRQPRATVPLAQIVS
jgi:hypothetical protein